MSAGGAGLWRPAVHQSAAWAQAGVLRMYVCVAEGIREPSLEVHGEEWGAHGRGVGEAWWMGGGSGETGMGKCGACLD